MAKTVCNLDYNKLFPLTLDYDPASQTLKVYVDRSANPGVRMLGALNQLMACRPDSSILSAPFTKTFEKNGDDHMVFHPVPPEFTLFMDQEPFAKCISDKAGNLTISEHRPLNADQTRTMGTHHNSKTWLSRTDLSFEEYDDLRALAKSAITTDFHTHSSGQISAKGLLKVAEAHDAYYPIHLLKELGIKDHFDDSVKRLEPRIKFPPLEPQNLPDEVECVSLKALSPEERRTLELHMSLRTDRQSSYTDAENKAYCLRYPFTKNTELLKDSLKEMARECLESGITYAEISFVGLDNPIIFRKAHEAIWEMEHDPELKAFSLRFKHGIPRTFTQQQFKESLEKAKVIAQSPYVTGIDVLGYEINKTNAFTNALDEFAIWMKGHASGLTLCVHAGENDKNPENVKDVLRLVEKHGIYARIGHGLYGLDDEAIELMKRLNDDPENPKVHIESNPGSNIALNNIDHVRNMPFRRMLDNGIPFIVSSDSLGLYQLSAEQLGVSLIHAGFTKDDLHILRQHQDRLLKRQLAYAEKAKQGIEDWGTEKGNEAFISKIEDEIYQVPKAAPHTHHRTSDSELDASLAAQNVEFIRNPKKLPEALKEKHPITIVGASGSSWKRISPGHQRDIAIAYDMLAHAVDPEKTYFVQGRHKAEGVNDAINTAMREVERTDLGKFSSVGILTDPKLDSSTDYSHLTHMVRIKNQLDVADEIVNFTVEHGGTLIAAGGAAYTRDIILKADRRMEKHNRGTLYVMDGPVGASTEKARYMDDSYLFTDGKKLIQQLIDKKPELFRDEFKNLDDAGLRKLYNDAANRVGDRYGLPSTKQTIEDVQSIPPHERGKS